MTQSSLRIDPDALDRELIQQPELFCGVAREYALAASRRDEAKENVAVAKATAYFVVRNEIEADGGKVTESAIGIQIELNPAYRKAVKKYQGAKLAADNLAADREALQQRAFMLKDLCALWIAGYYGQSSIRGEASRTVQDVQYNETKKRLARQRRKLNE